MVARLRQRAPAVAALFVVVAVLSGTIRSEEAPAPPPAPAEFFGTVMSTGGPGPAGMVRVTIAVQRWTTNEERKVLRDALKEGGTDQLVKALGEYTVGYVQIEDNLRWTLRLASTWQTEKGQMVRIATERPISFTESMRGFKTLEYPIGVAEFLMPPSGPGSGTLLAATKVQFNADGQLEVQSLPQNISPQQLTNLERIVPKEKKKKKAKA